MQIQNTSFILIFGGHSVDEEKAVSNLIAVDVDHLEWWYMTVKGGNVAPRITSSCKPGLINFVFHHPLCLDSSTKLKLCSS